MKDFLSTRRVRAVLLACGAVGLASVAPFANAVRVGGAPAPTASAVQGAAQEPAHVQADESASLRQGTIGAVDERGVRVRVQGVWIDRSRARPSCCATASRRVSRRSRRARRLASWS